MDASGKLAPWLAESWSQPNKTTYVYHINPHVKFSDGNELTAADVAFSLNYYRSPKSLDGYNFRSTLSSITAVNSDTVKITFTKPDAAWNSTIAGAQLGIFEKAFFEAHKATFGQPGTGVVGTGPWKIESFDSTRGAQLTANPHYWKEKPPFGKVSWSFFSSETSEAVALRTGEIDVAFPSSLKSFAATSDKKPLTASGGDGIVAFWMNTLDKPWNDIHVRRAVAYALDRNSLIQAAGGFADPVTTFIPPVLLQELGSKTQVGDAVRAVETYPYDLDEAKNEMAKSAYRSGVSVTLAALNEPDVVNVSQAVVAQLEKIGIHAKIKVETSEANSAELSESDRQAIHSQVVPMGALGLDPGGAFDWAIGSANASAGNWNATNWSNPTVDRLIAQGLSTMDPAQRLAIYKELLEQYGEGVPLVPLYTKLDSVALADGYKWPGFNFFSCCWSGPWPLQLEQSAG